MRLTWLDYVQCYITRTPHPLAWCRTGDREAERRTWTGSVHRERWVQRRRDLMVVGASRWWSQRGAPCAQSSLRAAKCAGRTVRPAAWRAAVDGGLPEWRTPRRAVRVTNRGWPDVADPPRNWALEAGGAELVERAAPAGFNLSADVPCRDDANTRHGAWLGLQDFVRQLRRERARALQHTALTTSAVRLHAASTSPPPTLYPNDTRPRQPRPHSCADVRSTPASRLILPPLAQPLPAARCTQGLRRYAAGR
jgi:hypothetical protein